MSWGAACKDRLLAHKLRNEQTPNPPQSTKSNSGRNGGGGNGNGDGSGKNSQTLNIT